MKLSGKQLTLNAIFCLLLLAAFTWLLYAEFDRPWKKYQAEYNLREYESVQKRYQALLLKNRGTGKDGTVRTVSTGSFDGKVNRFSSAESDSAGREISFLRNRLSEIPERGQRIKQLWLPDLERTERCGTCHLGVLNPHMASQPQPFRTHSGEYLKQHRIEKVGCMSCHEGQGAALTVEAAHGRSRNWDRPILTAAFSQSACGACHLLKQGSPLDTDLPGAPVFVKGWRLFQDYNCSGCHRLQGYNRPDYAAPSLTAIGDKVTGSWLVKWLRDPKQYYPDTKMPRYNFSDIEVEYISSYLSGLKSDQSGGSASLSPAGDNGEELVLSLGCLGCHTLNGKGNGFGPKLSGLGSKVKPEWLYRWLKEPGQKDRKTRMPHIKMADSDIQSIVAYLMTLKDDSERASILTVADDYPSEKAAKMGERLVKEYGCTGCHELAPLPERHIGPELDGIGDKRVDKLFFGDIPNRERSLPEWVVKKLEDPGGFATDQIISKMPQYNFSSDEREALAVFLLGQKKKEIPANYISEVGDSETASAKGKKVFETYNCLGCHRINGRGGETGPELTVEARKSNPEWLYSFLKNPIKIRSPHILKAAMPDFSLTDSEVNHLIAYLSSLAGEPYPYSTEEKRDILPEDIWDGEKLYQEVFACNACHMIDNHGGTVGPDHTDLASRAKRAWLEEWLKNPAAIKPDVRMPVYSFRDWEFEALTNYLMTLGRYRFVSVKETE